MLTWLSAAAFLSVVFFCTLGSAALQGISI